MRWALGFVLLTVVSAVGQTPAPHSFQDLTKQARQAYEANHDAEAARLFAAAVKMRPNWAEGWWALGMIDYEQNEYAGCRDSLTQMVKLAPSAAPGWALLGLCNFQLKQYGDALHHLKKAHMLVSPRATGGPLLNMANYHLAMLLTREGAFEVAQTIYAEVALKDPHNAQMRFASGLAALRMPILPSQVPAAQHEVVAQAGKTFWDLVTRPPQKAEADFKALVAAYPDFPNVHYFYGTYLAAHHPSRSDAEFKAELRISPDSVPARVELVLRYLQEGKLDAALKLAQEAVDLSPDSVGSQLALAEALAAKGKNQQALQAYLAAEHLDPNSPKIRFYIANAYRVLGQFQAMKREQAAYSRLKAENSNWP